MNITQYLKNNWQGGVAGGIGGFIATWIYSKLNYSLSFALTTQGLIDTTVGIGMTAKDLAFTKVGVLMILLGIAVGMIIDQHIPENWWRRLI